MTDAVGITPQQTLKRIVDDQKKILERLEKIDRSLNQLLKIVGQKTVSMEKVVGEEAPHKLPEHLRKTLLALYDLGEATASEVAPKTGRSRGLESIYLNQLERRGFVEKTRRARKVFFRLIKFL